MKVGIIVPVYNAEKYIEECFNSIANQTYKNIEAIFVDDCSTDNSYEILQNFIEKQQKNSKIKYKLIKHEKNGGVHISRNTGIVEALKSNCDYLSFMDNDDAYIPNAVEILVNQAKKYPVAEIVNGSTAKIDENSWHNLFSSRNLFSLPITEPVWGVIYENYINKNKLKDSEDVLIGNEIIKYYLDNSFAVKNFGIVPCGVWNALYKADFIKKYEIHYAKNLPNKEDVWFRYLCFKYATQVVLEYTPTYIYRIRQSSFSNSRDTNYIQIECSLRCFEKMLPDMDNKEISGRLAIWGAKWLRHWIIEMKSEKDKALLPRYNECFDRIKAKVENL